MKTKGHKITTVVAFIAIAIFYFWFKEAKMRGVENLKGEHTNTCETAINGLVTMVGQSRGWTTFRINDSSQFIVWNLNNFDLNPSSFSDFLKGDDLILKNASSDSLWVIRGDDKYLFVLNCSQKWHF